MESGGSNCRTLKVRASFSEQCAFWRLIAICLGRKYTQEHCWDKWPQSCGVILFWTFCITGVRALHRQFLRQKFISITHCFKLDVLSLFVTWKGGSTHRNAVGTNDPGLAGVIPFWTFCIARVRAPRRQFLWQKCYLRHPTRFRLDVWLLFVTCKNGSTHRNTVGTSDPGLAGRWTILKNINNNMMK